MTASPAMRALVAFYVAFALFAAVIVGVFAREVLPTPYLARPLLASGLLAALIAVMVLPARRHAPLAAATIAGLLIDPAVTGLIALVACAVVAILRLRRRSPDLTGALVVIATAYLLVGIVRAAPLLELPHELPAAQTQGQRVYVLLLDGYPRLDSLLDIGIDNRHFVAEMERRGFDHYPDATTRTGWTELTLTSMLANPTIPNDVTTNAEKRELRDSWELPAGYLAIDPPLGFATIPDVPHLAPVGVTDFEAHLVGQSLVGQLFHREVRAMLGVSVRQQHEFAVSAVMTTAAHRVFAHIAAPHPPFVFGGDQGSACWPECHLWKTTHESLNITQAEWASGMAGQLDGLNTVLLTMVDRLIAEDPQAVIVFFSDHGGRYSFDVPEEWHDSFLIARTPGHQALFNGRAHPPDLLPALAEAYGLDR